MVRHGQARARHHVVGRLRSSPITRLDGSAIAPAQIDATVERLMRAAEVPGVGVLLFAHGAPVYLRAYGMRDTAQRLPLTVDSVMTAASLTKPAFAFLLVSLMRIDNMRGT